MPETPPAELRAAMPLLVRPRLLDAVASAQAAAGGPATAAHVQPLLVPPLARNPRALTALMHRVAATGADELGRRLVGDVDRLGVWRWMVEGGSPSAAAPPELTVPADLANRLERAARAHGLAPADALRLALEWALPSIEGAAPSLAPEPTPAVAPPHPPAEQHPQPEPREALAPPKNPEIDVRAEDLDSATDRPAPPESENDEGFQQVAPITVEPEPEPCPPPDAQTEVATEPPQPDPAAPPSSAPATTADAELAPAPPPSAIDLLESELAHTPDPWSKP